MMTIDNSKCPFSEFDIVVKPNVLEHINERPVVRYSILFEKKYYTFNTNFDYYNRIRKDELYKYNYIIRALILNDKWPNEVRLLSNNAIIKTLSEIFYPKTPKEKLDHLFEFLFKTQTKDGETIDMQVFWSDEFFANQLYFKDNDECVFYMRALNEKGLINGRFGNSDFNNFLEEFNITFDGFDYYDTITNEGLKSKNCFVAMSFGEGMSAIRKAIKEACQETDFTPILIDEHHGDSDKTINDEIIANLKKSRFCIADFTEQKDGVYFESGYALGRGLKVIYTCSHDHFKESHFDTNHFPHILYSTPDELKEKLINKIEAWIKD